MPGCAIAARSGGFPPCTAVDSTVGVLSPVEVYLTLTPGNFLWKAASTSLKFLASAPAHTPDIEMLPLTA